MSAIDSTVRIRLNLIMDVLFYDLRYMCVSQRFMKSCHISFVYIDFVKMISDKALLDYAVKLGQTIFEAEEMHDDCCISEAKLRAFIGNEHILSCIFLIL